MEKCDYLRNMEEKDWKKIRRKCTIVKYEKWNNPRIVPDADTCLSKCRNNLCPVYFDAKEYVDAIKRAVRTSMNNNIY